MAGTEEIRVIHTTGMNNCGGRCIIHVHVKDGKIIKLTTDTQADAGDGVPLCACVRGLNYHKTFLGPDRLLWPMKRVGQRGEGKFERITWDEALDTIASEWIRIRDQYGPGSRYVNYATGISGVLRGDLLAMRLLALDGGFLGRYNSYSTACISQMTNLMYGTGMSGNMPEDWLNSHLIILWGHNPMETHFGADTMYYLRKAKEKGIPIIVVDPRRNDTALALDAEWIPLRPATDAALLDAMAWVIVERGLVDWDFLNRCCVGFDREHMPEGIDPTECVLDYLKGTRDGIPKTPEWAENITGVPAATIESLAVRYATAKPAALIQGYGAQRHAYGEQSARGGILLACMTGNVGVSGGWACGTGSCRRQMRPAFPQPANGYGRSIPSYLWTEAVERGNEFTALDGVKGGEKLDSSIKMLVNLAGNCLINQHGDINRTAEILRDTTKCEFIVCSDLFMTASAKFADILLPGVSMFETENITMPWSSGDFLGYVNQAIEPLGECRQEYDWLVELAGRLGLERQFSEGRTAVQWLESIYNELRKTETELPPFETFRQAGIWRYKEKKPVIAFEAQRRDPEHHPFHTPSGKVELFSEKVYRTEYREFFPAIPRYVTPPEGPTDPLIKRFPLQLIGWHTKRRCHSVHDNNVEMHKVDPQRLWMHPEDAEKRGLHDGEEALIYNDRGRIRLPVKVSDRLMRGVTAISQGAWYRPDETGTDTAGSINTLTSLHPTPYARGNPQHSNLVEVERMPGEDALRGKKVVFLGSSVTYGVVGHSFVEDIAERYGCSAIKDAVSGTTLADISDDSYVARLRRMRVEKGADLFVCQLSTNDAWQGVELGDVDDEDVHTVTGAIRAIDSLARDKFGCPVAFYPGAHFESDAYDQMVNRLKEIAEREGFAVIDLWNDRSFNNLPGSRYDDFMKDPVHPTLEGYSIWWTPRIALGLRRIISR
ncbi:MAG: molybdopterin-dependent oxidoreductase [Clostridia bacterium]|nr:molybdopterin-dependent oxidoreductase [Clostridia bacterium]